MHRQCCDDQNVDDGDDASYTLAGEPRKRRRSSCTLPCPLNTRTIAVGIHELPSPRPQPVLTRRRGPQAGHSGLHWHRLSECMENCGC
jgi:hypothetical protein